MEWSSKMNSNMNRLHAALWSAVLCVVLMLLIVGVWYESLNNPAYIDASSDNVQTVSSAAPMTSPPPPITTPVPLTTTTTLPPVTTTTQSTAPGTYADEVYAKRAYLTFDDGPSENTAAIIAILKKYNVKATFFVVGGRKAERYRLITESGNAIALHSMVHDYDKVYKSVDAYFADLCELEELVVNATGQRPKIIRFPGGSSNTISNKHCNGIMKTLVVEVERRGYTYFDWNVDSGDALDNNVPADKLLEKIKASCDGRKSVNILLHDTGKSKQTTVEALPRIIEYLQSEGYTILPITEGTKPVHHRSA